MGFQAIATMLALQCSTNQAMKTHTLGAGQFVAFILTRGRNETQSEDDIDCGNTNLNEDMIVEVVTAKIQYGSGNDNDFSRKTFLLLNVT